MAPLKPAGSGLRRALPTLLGVGIALGVVLAYELDLIEREPSTSECPSECPPDDQPDASRPRSPLFAGARPHPSSRKAQLHALAVEDQLALLEAQNQVLAERVVTGELSYYNHSQAELEAMARHCDVRMDYPKRLEPQEIEDLALEPEEQQAWERALQAFVEQERAYYLEILRELEPDTPGIDELPLAQIRRQLTKVAGRARSEADDSLQRHVAQERAGLREAPANPDQLSAWNRYNRLRFNAGDRFAALLGDELGDARVHELRSVFEGWPGAHTRQMGCPGEQAQ
ncbi:hypothetical protein DB30_04708 [Enhygromyxa salina]|uniref:Uncharacterized protein n=1 Tax=Enhygromyxa salina TaxID=215803 RepID=A0A0C1ZYF9_9BACT|nr:hypothetical protein [Enhygromyxa salina]KIG16248.1 hypothetical protein DB30_04708 [Enhygromyxa salina]